MWWNKIIEYIFSKGNSDAADVYVSEWIYSHQEEYASFENGIKEDPRSLIKPLMYNGT